MVEENFSVKVNCYRVHSAVGKICSGCSIVTSQPITTLQDETKACLLAGTTAKPCINWPATPTASPGMHVMNQ